ncbi:MAG: methyltransferase domain-containing protein [Hymenobacteraceae bacterium]|nr:methyltransferase domain-containing protein [Hymenobacteraceae bacterium]MDX5397387.1 methyltransferase domain-containing protein [Hymenobacteraceae bacterium]MDX5513465.1 methyltransferase domain-containing protein [Hymenobacteraceae bacterium]
MFAKRSEEPELMDELSLSGNALKQNLDELEVINKWLGGNEVVTDALDQLRQMPVFKPFSGKQLKIADLGCGGGDILREVAQWSKKRQQPVALTGIDANAFMINYATGKCSSWPQIQLLQQDIFSENFKNEQYDIVICSLFCHHFTNQQLIQMLQQFYSQAILAVIITDLHRHPLAYYSIKWLTAGFSKSYLVKNDAPLSVLRAFRKKELEQLLLQAGIKNFRLKWRWAFRWQLILIKE